MFAILECRNRCACVDKQNQTQRHCDNAVLDEADVLLVMVPRLTLSLGDFAISESELRLF